MPGGTPSKLLLSPPEVGRAERDLLLAAFDSNWVAPAGPDIDAFESELADVTGAPAVAALSSGTAGLELALMAVGVEAGDDVLMGTLTFAASAFAASHLGARPCFVDCEATTWHMDLDLLADELARRAVAGDLPAAVVSVDLYGSVADGARCAQICAEYDVPLVCDAAEAIGARRDGVHAGRHGRVGVLSFNGNKMVTTGGGGAIFSDDVTIVQRARYLSTQARRPVPWYEHDDIGFNFRMGNLNAAVGRGQLRTLPTRIERRHAVRRRYEHALSAIEGTTFQTVLPGVEPNYWLTTVAFAEDGGVDPTAVVEALRAGDIEARHGFKPMHLQPVYRAHPVVGGAVARDLFRRSVSLPSGARLTESDVDRVCAVILADRDGG